MNKIRLSEKRALCLIRLLEIIENDFIEKNDIGMAEVTQMEKEKILHYL